MGGGDVGNLGTQNQTHIADAAGARTLEKLKLKPFQLRDDKTMEGRKDESRTRRAERKRRQQDTNGTGT